MAKSEGPRSVLTLPLLTEPWQEHILEKRFKIMEHLYNSLVSFELKKLRRVQQMPEYRELDKKIQETPKEKRKTLYNKKDNFLKKNGFSEYAFKDDIISMQKHFVQHIATQIARQTAVAVWQAFDKYLFGNGKKVHFKRRGTLNSASNEKANVTLFYEDNCLTWKGGQCKNPINVAIKVAYPQTDYEREMLTLEHKYYRIVRKWVKTRFKYYLQIILVGNSVVKKKHTVKEGRVGIDIGTQSIAIASDRGVHLYELADRVNTNHKRMLYLQRKMDASRRSTNPDNYNVDGTIKRGIKLRWTYSNHYKRYAAQVRQLQRKNADIRKQQHYELANEILQMGNEIYVEPMEYKALQKRAKETTVNAKGRYNRKKRFGKSLANKAPAALLTILKNKLKTRGMEGLHEVDKWEYKASQYDHLSKQYHKKKLSQRTTQLENGDTVQRDLYAAFLLMNAGTDLKSPDQTLCEQTYERFKQLHDMEIARLKSENKTHLSSFGVA